MIDFDKIENINVDFVVGFGESCRIAEALNRNHLRYFSSPFDWMIDYDLDVVSNLLSNYVNKKELNFFSNCYEDKIYSSENCKGIIDSNNGMISMHDFPIDMDIKEAPRFFYEKYIHRFDNLNNMLERSRRVCFLTNRKITLEEMKTFVCSMKQLYKLNQLYYINIYDTDIESVEQYKDEGVRYIIYKFNDKHINGHDKKTNTDYWLGNVDYWDKILSKISLNNFT